MVGMAQVRLCPRYGSHYGFHIKSRHHRAKEHLIPARRNQRLHDFLESCERLTSRGVRGQRRISRGVEQLRVGFGGESQHAGDRNVGVADALAEPPGRCDAPALLLQ